MGTWQYLLLVNVYLVLFYSFYVLLLRKETFFQLNRIYLVSAAALSFFIPLMQAGWVQNLFITQEIKYTVYNSPVLILQMAPVKESPVNIGQILASVYIAGVIVLFSRLIWQLSVLTRIIKKDQHDTAYSFFNKINLPDEVKDNNIVTVHEQVHARQWHSVDVFIIEAVMIINWFNPIVYFYRRAIKHVHEFIADDHATNKAANKADYAMLLLTQTFHAPSHNLVNNFFNHSLLKQRIIMLQKNKSQRVKLLKYGLSAPLFMLMLVLSSATVNNSKTVKAINNKITQVLLLPPNSISNINKLSAFSAMSKPSIIATRTKNKKLSDTSPKTDVTDTVSKDNSQIFVAVEQEPSFPGGSVAFASFLAKNIRYPAAMRDAGVQGKVIVTFVVEKDGTLSGIRALRGPGEAANEEAVRVVSTSPNWMPGYQNGKAVRVQFTIPIMFSLATFSTAANTNTSKRAATVTMYTSKKNTPLYLVDGKEIKPEDFKSVSPSDIKSVYILKDKAAIMQCGSKGKYGVVLIFTKAYTGPLPASAKTDK